MRFYPAGETITRRLPGLQPEHSGWFITGAETGDIIAASFQCYQAGKRILCMLNRVLYTGFHGAGMLTILAIASDGGDIIDPLDGNDAVTINAMFSSR